MFKVTHKNLVVEDTGMTGIDESLVGPGMGTIVVLEDDTGAMPMFSGVVARLNVTAYDVIRRPVYGSMSVVGTDADGAGRTAEVLVTASDLRDKSFFGGRYNVARVIVPGADGEVETLKPDDVLVKDRSVMMFNSEIALGDLVSVKYGDKIVNGVVTKTASDNSTITVTHFVNNRQTAQRFTISDGVSGGLLAMEHDHSGPEDNFYA